MHIRLRFLVMKGCWLFLQAIAIGFCFNMPYTQLCTAWRSPPFMLIRLEPSVHLTQLQRADSMHKQYSQAKFQPMGRVQC